MINYAYYIVGTGGTGSYLVDHLGRLFGTFGQFSTSYRSVELIDADQVSDSNVSRQRFYYRDIYRQKTTVLEQRLRIMSELSRVNSHNVYLTKTLLKTFLKQDTRHKCFISCVDNNTSRNRILSVLKPDPASNVSPYTNWTYIDSGNTAYDGWVSMMVCDEQGNITGIDMRNQDGDLRADADNDAPVTDGGGCGQRTAPYQTASANQRNADLIAAQLTSHLRFGRSFGFIGWTVPNMEADDWSSTVYETAHLCPIG